MTKLFGNEFDRFDICTNGPGKEFGPYFVEIYKLMPPITFPLGPLSLQYSKSLHCPASVCNTGENNVALNHRFDNM